MLVNTYEMRFRVRTAAEEVPVVLCQWQMAAFTSQKARLWNLDASNELKPVQHESQNFP